MRGAVTDGAHNGNPFLPLGREKHNSCYDTLPKGAMLLSSECSHQAKWGGGGGQDKDDFKQILMHIYLHLRTEPFMESLSFPRPPEK